MIKEEIDDWSPYCTLESHESTVWKISFDGTGNRLASAGDDKMVKIWQAYQPGNKEGVATMGKDETWKCVCTLAGYHARAVFDLDWSHLHGRIVTASGDDFIRVFRETENSDQNQPSFVMTASVNGHIQDVNSVAWNPKQANLLASCSDDGMVKLWTYCDVDEFV